MYQFKINVAGVVFLVYATYFQTQEFFERFVTDEPEQYKIFIDSLELVQLQKQYPHFSLVLCERAALKYKMDAILVNHGAFAFHASALSYRGQAYIFTALSGVGKSTHSRMWRESLENVVMINDDRPYLKVIGDEVWAYSHPQSGKDHIYTNISAKVRAIGRIVRDQKNFVKEVSKSEFFPYMIQQSFTMDTPEMTATIISNIKIILDKVYLCEIHCNMEPDTGRTIYNQMEKNISRKQATLSLAEENKWYR